jgi:GH15 family glucan-1,4-alpha-glucosidase
MTFWQRFERVGYLRAASLMDREGYPELATKMRETANELKQK